jgi:hypothetical protein
MPARTALSLIMTVLFTIFCSGTSRAADVEKLLMPGRVSAAHADIEGKCESCHDRSNRGRQTALCLDCHKETAADVRAGAGFHGRMPGAKTGQCQACHSEHHGRKADIVHLDPARFDHSLTDFALTDAHAVVACDACHQPKQAFRKASSTCIGCHRNDDAHDGNLGTECKSCHTPVAWRQVAFDHEKTRFPLRERHREVPCAACHFGEKYKSTPMQCASCHAPDDVHRGTRGAQCSDCHTVAGWKEAKFDHERETGFALLGRHARIGCTDCHRSGNLTDPVPTECSGCHRSDDRHASRFGTNCGDCHANETWRVTAFNHLERAKFALEGAHVNIDCHACHTGVLKKQKLDTQCGTCHRADDVHGGALGINCEQCHGSYKWNADLGFDHDLSTFPLVGLHVVVTCAQCHTSQEYKNAPTDCNGCHAKSDVHEGRLGTQCSDCHSPNGWNLWEFDHKKHTRFALTGAHAPLECAACHVRPPAELQLSTDCGSCHASDDIHAGQFGRQCQRCHSTISFRGARSNRELP